MPADATESAAEHNSRLQLSINLHAPVTTFMFAVPVPMYYPGGRRLGYALSRDQALSHNVTHLELEPGQPDS